MESTWLDLRSAPTEVSLVIVFLQPTHGLLLMVLTGPGTTGYNNISPKDRGRKGR